MLDFIKSISETVPKLPQIIYNTFVGILDNVIQGIKDLPSKIYNGFSSVLSGIKTVLGTVKDTVVDIGSKVVNLGGTIIDGFKSVFEGIYDWFKLNFFTIDFDRVYQTANVEQQWHNKFSLFYDISDRLENFKNGTGTASLSSDGIELMATNTPLKIYMDLPDFMGGGEACILDLDNTELLKLFKYCRMFLTFSLWFAFAWHLINTVAPKIRIS